MRTIHLDVQGMRCRRCVRQATALLRDLPGVATLSADPVASRVTITGDVTDASVLEALAGSTFTVRITPAGPEDGPGPGPRAP